MNSTGDLQYLEYYEQVYMSNEKGKPKKRFAFMISENTKIFRVSKTFDI